MLRKIATFSYVFVMLAALGGCATVDPRHDYEQVGQRVVEATGQERVYRPEDDELVDEIVEGLTQDGISCNPPDLIPLDCKLHAA